jgi:hypothetical protein
MQNRVILVAFILPKPLHYEFDEWPNHITLVPYFNTNDYALLDTQLKDLTESVNPIAYEIGETDFFGANQKVKVSLIVKNMPLQDLHTKLLNVALQHDNKIDVRHCGVNYIPHITHNESTVPSKGDQRKIMEFYLVKKVTNGSKLKMISGIYRLQK